MKLPLCSLIAIVAALLSGCSSPGGSTGGVSGGGSLPAHVDLTQRAWFPPVVAQQGFSCSQQTGLYYLFGAEWNQSGWTPAGSPMQRFSPYFAYSVAGTESGRSHVVDGWITAQQCGVPLLAHWPYWSRNLMHGYNRYLQAMRYRVDRWEVLPVTTLTEVARVERLLADGRPVACDFQIRGAELRPLPKPQSLPAPSVVVGAWGRSGPGHSMVYAGYNRDLAFDSNNDGRITTDVDINGDGQVTLADCERGAFLVVNPWGGGWGDRGKAWVPVRLHAVSAWPWSRAVATVRAAEPSYPRLTLKLRLRATDRQNVIVTVHRSGREVQPWIFSHTPAPAGGASVWDSLTTLRTPGPHLTAGTLAAPDGGPLETGHDLSALGGSADGCTLEIRPAGRGSLQGVLAGAAIIEHDADGRPIKEVRLSGLPATLPAAGGVWTH